MSTPEGKKLTSGAKTARQNGHSARFASPPSLGLIFDQLPVQVLVWDATLQLLFANAPALALVGLPNAEAALGRRWIDIVPNALKRSCRDCVGKALAGEVSTVERRVTGADGTTRQTEITFSPSTLDGAEPGFSIVMHDVTHRTTTESVLRRHAQELAASAASWQHRANTDQLTGLVNRHHLEHLVNHAEPGDGHRALLLLDLDGFKEVNDIFGHAAGDEVLVEIATRLSENVRSPDVIARLGGDEFVVFVPEVASAEGAETLAERLLSQIAQPIPVLGGTTYVTVSASIGIAVDTARPDARKRFVSLIAQADSLMYDAKPAGNNWKSGIRIQRPETSPDEPSDGSSG